MGDIQDDAIDIIPAERAGTLPGLLAERAARDPARTAYADHVDGHWRRRSWQQMAALVGRLRQAFADASLRPGDRIAILCPNSSDWVAADLAAMANGLIVVPLYVHDSPANLAFILRQTEARLCLVDGIGRWATVEAEFGPGEGPETVWLSDPAGGGAAPAGRRSVPLASVLASCDREPPPAACAPGDVATIIYTSGTTGRPKGVALTHGALLWNAEAITRVVPPRTDDLFLSVLPLAHAFERCMGCYMPMMAGSQVTYARSVDDLADDLRTVRPTVLVGVPRLYERAANAIVAKAGRRWPWRSLLEKTGALGWKMREARCGRQPAPGPVARYLLWPILDGLLGRRVRASLGGRLRVAVSGGAPLPVPVARFLVGLGLPMVEGYGLTEAGPVVTATTLDDFVPGTAGRPLPGLEVRISDGGELLVRSPGVMAGYWRAPEKTAATLSADGWLCTGDAARIEDGRIVLVDRLKDLIALSTGKKIAPRPLEAAMERCTLVEQVCVLGDGRPCPVAVATLRDGDWQSFARQNGLDPDRPNAPAARSLLLERLVRETRAFPEHERVRAVHLVARPWTVADGTLTPTLKVKRRMVEARFPGEIEALFAGLHHERKPGQGTPSAGPTQPDIAKTRQRNGRGRGT